MYISLIAFYFCLICFYFSVCLLSDNKIQILLHRVNGCWFLYVTNIVFVNKHLLYYDFHFVASMSVYSHTQHTHMPSLALFALVTRNQSCRGNTVKVWPLKQEVRTFPSNVCYNEQLSVNYQMDVTVHTSIVCVCILNHVSVFVWTGLTLWVYHVLYIYISHILVVIVMERTDDFLSYIRPTDNEALIPLDFTEHDIQPELCVV